MRNLALLPANLRDSSYLIKCCAEPSPDFSAASITRSEGNVSNDLPYYARLFTVRTVPRNSGDPVVGQAEVKVLYLHDPAFAFPGIDESAGRHTYWTGKVLSTWRTPWKQFLEHDVAALEACVGAWGDGRLQEIYDEILRVEQTSPLTSKYK